MTEDDTFNALRKLTFLEVLDKWHKYDGNDTDESCLRKFFNSTGWTLEDFRSEYKNYWGKQ